MQTPGIAPFYTHFSLNASVYFWIKALRLDIAIRLQILAIGGTRSRVRRRAYDIFDDRAIKLRLCIAADCEKVGVNFCECE
jgi:hypothetical protein